MEYQPRFLYPTSRQYPIDALCERIVRALETKKWTVPGIKVEFHVYGTGELKYRYVQRIEGRDFLLYFGRIQGRLDGGWNDTAAIDTLVINGKQLELYEDHSGPSLYVYTGGDWDADCEAFKKERKYDERHALSVSIPRKKQEHGTLFKEFDEHLTHKVLDVILASPDSLAMQVEESRVVYPAHLGPFYVRVDTEEERRITQGKANPLDLQPEDRFALRGGGGGRLVELGVRNDGTLPEVAYGAYAHCQFSAPIDAACSRHRWVCIRPRHATHIFVCDESPGDAYKKTAMERDGNASMLTEGEYGEWQRCNGRTIVPIHQYDGSYARPVVLVGSEKELTFDEVEFV